MADTGASAEKNLYLAWAVPRLREAAVQRDEVVALLRDMVDDQWNAPLGSGEFDTYCVYCDAIVTYSLVEAKRNPVAHTEDCPWRRAREYVEGLG